MNNDLYKRDLYTTGEYDYIISKKIFEYDITQAGWNLCKYYELLPESKLKILSKMSKTEKHIQIGKYERDDREFNKNLTKSFSNIRKLFIEENDIDDSNILAIRKDAIFIIGKKCNNLKFGNVEFVLKNVYSSYHKFNNIELYYNCKKNILDVKGINNNVLYLHENFMNFLKHSFKLLEYNNKDQFIKFIKNFTYDYKLKNLDVSFYREFNPRSVYNIKNPKLNSRVFSFGLTHIDKNLLDEVDISYNYMRYILPIIQRYYFN
jgi:hypothetical protein